MVAELIASHNNNLLLPCTVDCSNPALSTCSLRSPHLLHTRAHSFLAGPVVPTRYFSTLTFSPLRGSTYHPWIPDLWERRPHGIIKAEPSCLHPSCFPASDFHRNHRNLKSFRVRGKQTQSIFSSSLYPHIELHLLDVLLVCS